jgi:hypothetical protein
MYRQRTSIFTISLYSPFDGLYDYCTMEVSSFSLSCFPEEGEAVSLEQQKCNFVRLGFHFYRLPVFRDSIHYLCSDGSLVAHDRGVLERSISWFQP